MQKDNLFFQGISKKTQRFFFYNVLSNLKISEKIKKVIIPCAGMFTLAKISILAGYKPKNIYCSDISFIANILGFFFAGVINPIEFKFSIKEEIEEEIKGKDEEKKIATLLFYYKLGNLGKNPKEQAIKEYFLYSKEKQIKNIIEQMKEEKKILNGINYKIKDFREYLSNNNDDEIIIIHPPLYKSGYKKQNENEYIKYAFIAEEFDYKKEIEDFVKKTFELKSTFLITTYGYNLAHLDAKYQVFVERVKKRGDIYFCNNPELINKCIAYKKIENKKVPNNSKKYKILESDYVINENTVINIIKTDKYTALSYRDLFAHKMGSTEAESYYLILLDKKVFGISGFHCAELRRLLSNDILEVFAFNIFLKNHISEHRFLMMLLTCTDMKRILINSNKYNRIFELKGFKTICLTKYKKLRSSNNLLTIESRKKMKNGNYHLLYRTDFYKKSFKEILNEWLEYEKNEKESGRGK